MEWIATTDLSRSLKKLEVFKVIGFLPQSLSIIGLTGFRSIAKAHQTLKEPLRIAKYDFQDIEIFMILDLRQVSWMPNAAQAVLHCREG